ncbi:hypothetical protein CFP56_001738 [Quercus suber]|uniref:RNase H type-1 domain-containing protein n=1 Tax=Quercus suber TaxID=58331 RepID=A0AAW0ILL5_QUESU
MLHLQNPKPSPLLTCSENAPTLSVFGTVLAHPQVYTTHLASLYQIGCMTIAPLLCPLGTTAYHGPLSFFLVFASSKVPSARPRLNAKWDKPPPGWYKLNIDASIINGHAGASGLLRDSNGTWVQGFSKPLGIATVLMAEL